MVQWEYPGRALDAASAEPGPDEALWEILWFWSSPPDPGRVEVTA